MEEDFAALKALKNEDFTLGKIISFTRRGIVLTCRKNGRFTKTEHRLSQLLPQNANLRRIRSQILGKIVKIEKLEDQSQRLILGFEGGEIDLTQCLEELGAKIKQNPASASQHVDVFCSKMQSTSDVSIGKKKSWAVDILSKHVGTLIFNASLLSAMMFFLN